MKKIIYKFIFSIAFVLLGLFMLPKKEVKALENDFAPILIKATFVSSFYDVENANTYEFVNTYKLDGIFINNLNRFEYFFVTKDLVAIDNSEINRLYCSYQIEEIQIEDNSTKFYVRVTVPIYLLVGVEYADEFFSNDSAFYVWVMYDDIAGQAYNDGYNDGWNNGYEYGRDEGYTDGYNDGYEKGSEVGYEAGYEIGFENGNEAGYDEGYIIGRDEGYNNGYNVGFNVGFDDGYTLGNTDGFEDGFVLGREQGYNEGYNRGYNAGINEQLEDRDFASLLRSVFIAIGAFLGINLLPGISIGAIIAVPIVFGIIAFILGKRKD